MTTTQAQIDALKQWLIQGSVMINALTPCDPVQQPYTWTQFQGAFFGNKSFQSVLCDTTNQPLLDPQGHTIPASSYKSTVGTGGYIADGYVIWPPSQSEHHAIAQTKYGQWGIIVAYGNTTNGDVYGQELIRAEWINETTGVVQDISDMLPGVTGTPYCPNNLPPLGSYTMRQWFWAHNDVRVGGARNRPCFWQARFNFGQTVTNHCWTGTPQTLPAVRMAEAWWDSSAGWVYGTGTPLPWDMTNPTNPTIVVPTITYYTDEAFGLGTGVLWQFHEINPTYNVAMASIT